MIELGLCHAQACLDIPKAFPEGELGKGHGEKLIPAGEALDLVVAVVTIDTLAKLVSGQEVHQLRENRFACTHRPSPPAWMREYRLSQAQTSNR